MAYLKKICVISITFLLLSCASSTADKQPTQVIPAGKWKTKIQIPGGSWVSHGIMTFPDNKKANYTLRNGRILWTEISDQGEWKGYWVENNQVYVRCSEEKDGSNSWGEAIFQFNETYTEFKGTWDTCGKQNRNAWVGHRVEEE